MELASTPYTEDQIAAREAIKAVILEQPSCQHLDNQSVNVLTEAVLTGLLGQGYSIVRGHPA